MVTILIVCFSMLTFDNYHKTEGDGNVSSFGVKLLDKFENFPGVTNTINSDGDINMY